MNQQKIIKTILDRLDRLESIVLSKTNKKTAPRPSEKNYKGATGGIRLLISNGLFKKKVLFPEIKQALGQKGYFYSPQAIQRALDRLSSQKGQLVKIKQMKKNFYAERK